MAPRVSRAPRVEALDAAGLGADAPDCGGGIGHLPRKPQPLDFLRQAAQLRLAELEDEASDDLELAAWERHARLAELKAELRLEEDIEAKRSKRARTAKEMEDRLFQAKENTRALASFLQAHGYAGVNTKRHRLCTFKYPLHTAVKLGNTNIIRLLRLAAADQTLKNSLGETPRELAERLYKDDDALRRLVQSALID